MPAHSAPAATEPSDLWAIVGTGWIWGTEMYPTLQCVEFWTFVDGRSVASLKVPSPRKHAAAI